MKFSYSFLILILIFTILTVIILLGRRDLQHFLQRHETIEDDNALIDFKNLAKRQMLLWLAVFGFGAAFMFDSLLSIYFGDYYLMTLDIFGIEGIILLEIWFIILLPLILVFWYIPVKKKVQSLQCADDALQAEYEKILKIWKKKLLPDFELQQQKLQQPSKNLVFLNIAASTLSQGYLIKKFEIRRWLALNYPSPLIFASSEHSLA